MDETRRVKGTLVLSRIKYLGVQGQGAVSAVRARLSEDDRVLLDGTMILPACWYPAGLLKRLDAAIADALASGRREAMLLDLGHFSADLNLGPTGVLRPYVREDDPQALLREVPNIHASQHGAGHRSYERLGEHAAVIRTVSASGFEGDDCLTTVGWLKRAIELCGGRDVEVSELRCLARGAPCCEYLCEWG
jgi:hypothetical protein